MLGDMRSLVFLLFLLISLPLLAEGVYKWTTADGEVVYSDVYQPGAERVHVSGTKSSPSADSLAGETGEQTTAATGSSGYQTFEIVQPENDETIRSNEGIVAVSLMMSPALANDNAIQIFVDGNKLEGELKSTQFTLNDLERGTHSLEAKIVDGEGKVMTSAPRVSFHLRKASIIKP